MKMLKRENIQKVDFMKIDVEGADIQVLEGAKELLKQQKPKMIMDVDVNGDIDKKKFFNLLKKSGYKIYVASDNFRFDSEIINEDEFISKNPIVIYAE